MRRVISSIRVTLCTMSIVTKLGDIRASGYIIHFDAVEEHGTNMTSLPDPLTTHHAVGSWQGGYICFVLLYGVQMYTGVFRP